MTSPNISRLKRSDHRYLRHDPWQQPFCKPRTSTMYRVLVVPDALLACARLLLRLCVVDVAAQDAAQQHIPDSLWRFFRECQAPSQILREVGAVAEASASNCGGRPH